MTDPSTTTTQEPAINNVAAAALNSRDLNHHPNDNDKANKHYDTSGNAKSSDQKKMKANHPSSSLESHSNGTNDDDDDADERVATTTIDVVDDQRLPPNVQQDPRGGKQRMTQKATQRGKGRNTESFDPNSTLVRPDVRVLVGNPQHAHFQKTLKHDDVVIVPELFGPEDDWSTYYQLVEEVTALQASHVKGSEFIAWHEGSHLICKEPSKSPTFQKIIQRLCEYFDIDAQSAGTRFNWYKDSQDWKVT